MLSYSIKNTFANMTTDFIRIFKYWEAVSVTMADTFSKTVIFAWTLECFQWQQILSNCFPWSGRLTLLIFEKMFARYPSQHKHSLTEVLSSKNGVAWKKWLVGLSKDCISTFPWHNHHSLVYRSAWCLLPISLSKILKRCTQGLRLVKLMTCLLHQKNSVVKLVI